MIILKLMMAQNQYKLGLQCSSGIFKNDNFQGGDKVIDVIDVARQADSKMKLHDFVEYYYSSDRPKVLNVISLEFSDTRMSDLVVIPDIAQMMSWVENYWPDDSVFPKPFVQKYCLMGVKDSYTDFHIDFGGTSVWYHVLWGEKIFYLIEPTQANLALYEAWSSSPNQSEVFFGDKVDKCYKCVVRQGTTLLIPTGWIHAVLTSQDCMAFGGNFLHNLNISMQLSILMMHISPPELREDNCQPPAYLIEGLKALTTALKSWLKREINEPYSEVPDHIRPGHLIKELTKEIRYQEEDHNGNKAIKSQGTVTRSTLERGSTSQARRNARRLRDHGTKTPSNLDILELHTREVLRRLEMASWDEQDILYNSSINGKFNKIFQPSASERKNNDNNIRLVLSNGKIVKDERHQVENKSLFTADRMPVDVKEKTQEVLKIKDEGEDLEIELEKRKSKTKEKRKPLNMFFESVKSELRNGVSGHSDLSDSEAESEDNFLPQRKNSSDEDTNSSSEEADEEEVSSNRKIEKDPGDDMDLYQPNQKHEDQDKPLKRERPTSQSMEEEAIQGMLSMAGLLYPIGAPSQKEVIRDASGAHRKKEFGDESQDRSLGPHLPNAAVRLTYQDEIEVQKHIRKDCTAELSQRIQENKNFMDSQSSSNSNSSDCWANDRYSVSTFSNSSSPLGDDGVQIPEFQYSESSLSPPLHPSKRPASNPPPVSNQATKALANHVFKPVITDICHGIRASGSSSENCRKEPDGCSTLRASINIWMAIGFPAADRKNASVVPLSKIKLNNPEWKLSSLVQSSSTYLSSELECFGMGENVLTNCCIIAMATGEISVQITCTGSGKSWNNPNPTSDIPQPRSRIRKTSELE
ncbi:KDM7A demethylase, partial [Polypterus senegalus]